MKTLEFELILQAASPIAHHSHVEGNVGVLAREQFLSPSGEKSERPYVSGNSMRHGMREAMTLLTLDALGLLDGGKHFDSLDSVRLLFNGGSGSGSENTVKLDDMRAMQQLVPALAIFGGSTRGNIHEGRLEVAPAQLICEEAVHKLKPWHLSEMSERGFIPTSTIGYETTIDEFHRDETMTPRGRFLLTDTALALLNDRRGKREKASDDGDEVAAAENKSSLMPHSAQAVIPGTLWTWSVVARCLTDLEEMTARAAISAFTRRMVVGSGRRVARGRFEVWACRGIDHLRPSEAALVLSTDDLQGPTREDPYVAHVRERAAEAKQWLRAQ